MRTFLGVTALAVLMLTLAGVHPVKAAVKYCDVAPENCFHGGDGRLYYLPPGGRWQKAYNAGKVTLPEIVERTRKQRECALHSPNGFCRLGPPTGGNGASQSRERAAWGCAATDGKVQAKSWNNFNRAAASDRALAKCARKATNGSCRVVSCRPAVRTYNEAEAIWGSKGPQ